MLGVLVEEAHEFLEVALVGQAIFFGVPIADGHEDLAVGVHVEEVVGHVASLNNFYIHSIIIWLDGSQNSRATINHEIKSPSYCSLTRIRCLPP